MHAVRSGKQSRRPHDEAAAVDGLVVSGLTELALGAPKPWGVAVGLAVEAARA